MNRLRITLIIAVSAAFLGVAGVALALVKDDDESLPEVPAPVVGVLAEGIAPSGSPYTVSQVDGKAGSTMFCYEISTKVASAQGCQPVPDADGQYEGRPVKSGRTLLGTDRFISTLAADDVETMRVTTTGSDTVTARSIDVDGVGRLLIAPIGGPPVTSDTPDADRTVQFLDSEGHVVREESLLSTAGD